MSVENFIPELVEADVEVAFHREAVVIPTLKPTVDGTIASGNAVTVIGAQLPTVQDYAANGRRFTAEEIETTSTKVLIDQEKIVPTRVDNVDRRQAAGELAQFTDLQAPALAKDADKYVIAQMISGGTQGATAVVDSAAKAEKAVDDLAEALDTAEVPGDGRYLLVNAKGKALLRAALKGSTSPQAAGGTELRKNEIGEVAGFRVIWSNDFPAGIDATKGAFIAYHESAAAYVGQVDESRAIPAPDGHADIVSTLLVYGAKVTRAAAVVVAGFTKPAAPASGE